MGFMLNASALLNGPMRDALRACRRHLGAAALFSALVNLLYIAPTLYMLQVYDRVVPTQGLHTLAFLTLVLVFALGTLALLDRLRTKLLVRAGVRLDAVLAHRILDATIGRSDIAEARQAIREFDGIRTVLTGPGMMALLDAPWMPIYIIVCTIVHPWIGVLALFGCVLLPLLAWLSERATHERLGRAQQAAALAYAQQENVIDNAEVVRALGMRRALVLRQMRQRRGMLVAQTEAAFSAGRYLTLTKFARLALQSLALGLGAWLAVDRQVSPGAIFASSFLIARALSPVEQLIANLRNLALALRGWRNLDVLLSAMPLETDITSLPVPNGALAVDKVVVRHPSRDAFVLQNVSCNIASGEVVAIVGPSGAGKSTLVRAIAGAIVPDRGAIRIDNADMRDWDHERLARHIGYLPQEPVLFAGTIAENIARFSGDADMDRATVDEGVIAAAQTVGAHDMILALPGGYDHRLAFGGRGLSAGQAQRVALARAVFGDPPLLILDEPNAHLDADGDAQLIEVIATLKKAGKTILIVSHKMGILPVVDRILLLREGWLIMFGPREEVLAKLAPELDRRIAQTRMTKS
jgi:ATP-binding cassette subfamily C protein